MVKHMKDRNYLTAADVYVKVAIGNAPWPIGVTSVGIHERKAREKIGSQMNGAAHIMNDEASRKYLQGLKRMITWMQVRYPTDPSRCVEFNAMADNRAALLSAEARGEVDAASLAPAPTHLAKDGSVLPPVRWEYELGRAHAPSSAAPPPGGVGAYASESNRRIV